MSDPMPARRAAYSYGGGGPPLWRTQFWSATMWIIVVTSAVSVLDMFLLGGISRFGALSLDGIRHFFLWQLFTYQLLHAGPLHLIFNMLWLYLLSSIVEPMIGKRRFVMLYAICGLAGGVAFLIVEKLGIGGVPRDATLVGASGSILGIMAAATFIAPRYPIRFWFPPITVQLWVIFLIVMVLALLAVRMAEFNAGGEAAHIGGAVAGLIGFVYRSRLHAGLLGKKKPALLAAGRSIEQVLP